MIHKIRRGERKWLSIGLNPEGELVCFEETRPIEQRASLAAWSQDFFRKLEEFNWLRHLLIRLVLGRHAYRELCGMIGALRETKDWIPSVGYGLEDMEYHKEKLYLPIMFRNYYNETYNRKRQ